MSLVRAGETTIEELQRVAAAPVRSVTEPSVHSIDHPIRIGWLVRDDDARTCRLHEELVTAASMLGSRVVVTSVARDAAAVGELDAAIVGVPGWRRLAPSHPLVVALTADADDQRRLAVLGRDADLVLSIGTHGRLVLATVLALLRWRSGG